MPVITAKNLILILITIHHHPPFLALSSFLARFPLCLILLFTLFVLVV
jgi:hypothetical protein